MKSHFAEEIDDVASAHDTAAEHVWREHRLDRSKLIGEFAAVVLTLLVVALWGSLTSMTGPASQSQSEASMSVLPPQELLSFDGRGVTVNKPHLLPEEDR